MADPSESVPDAHQQRAWELLSWRRDLAAALRSENFVLARHLAGKILEVQPADALTQQITSLLQEKAELGAESSEEDSEDEANGTNGHPDVEEHSEDSEESSEGDE